MGASYEERSRVSTAPGRWLNAPSPSVRYVAQIRAPMTALVTLTADTNAHTYGAWTQLIASTANDSSMLLFNVGAVFSNGVASGTLISIGVGAAGSETEIGVVAVGSSQYLTFQIPIRVLAGTRISARTQSVITGGKTCQIGCQTFDVDPYLFGSTNTSIDCLGVSTATSRGTAISASSVYSEIVSSTTQTYRGLVVIPSFSTTTASNLFGSMTVAVGSSGSEIDLGSIHMQSTTVEILVAVFGSMFIPAVIPAGSRISVKQSTTAAYFDATVIGIPL